MLLPLKGNDQIFGYCGLNINETLSTLLQSVGGLSKFDYLSDEPIWGVAEYHPRAANRSPSEIAAPPDVMAAWIHMQMELIKNAKLSEQEIQSAIANLTLLHANIRPVFRILTNRGPLGLDEFIDAVRETKLAIFPVRQLGSTRGLPALYSALPSLDSERSTFQLDETQIAFGDFTVYNSVFPFGLPEADLHNATDRTLWGVIISRLNELGFEYELSISPTRIIGKYIGLDSDIHNISKGSDIVSAAVELKIL